VTLRKNFAVATEAMLLAAFGNVAVFALVTVILGGSAFYGGIEQGQFVLKMGAADDPVLVPKWVYFYSLWHGWSVILGGILFLIVVAINELAWRGVRRRPSARIKHFPLIGAVEIGVFFLAVLIFVARAIFTN